MPYMVDSEARSGGLWGLRQFDISEVVVMVIILIESSVLSSAFFFLMVNSFLIIF